MTWEGTSTNEKIQARRWLPGPLSDLRCAGGPRSMNSQVSVELQHAAETPATLVGAGARRVVLRGDQIPVPPEDRVRRHSAGDLGRIFRPRSLPFTASLRR